MEELSKQSPQACPNEGTGNGTPSSGAKTSPATLRSCLPSQKDWESDTSYKARLVEHFNQHAAEELGVDMTPRANSVRDYPRAFVLLAAGMAAAGSLAGLPALFALYAVAKATTLLIQHDRNMAAAKKRRDAQNFLFYHAKTGNLSGIRSCLRQGADINAFRVPNEDHLIASGSGICIRDAYYGYHTTMRESDHGKTALILAAENGHEQLVYALVAQGADPFLKFNTQKATCMITAIHHHGDMAAHFARKNKHAKIAGWLDSLNKPAKPKTSHDGPKLPSPHAG